VTAQCVYWLLLRATRVTGAISNGRAVAQ